MRHPRGGRCAACRDRRIPGSSTVLRLATAPSRIWRGERARRLRLALSRCPVHGSPIRGSGENKVVATLCWRAIRAGPDRRRRDFWPRGDAAPFGPRPTPRFRRVGEHSPRRWRHRADCAAARLQGTSSWAAAVTASISCRRWRDRRSSSSFTAYAETWRSRLRVNAVDYRMKGRSSPARLRIDRARGAPGALGVRRIGVSRSGREADSVDKTRRRLRRDAGRCRVQACSSCRSAGLMIWRTLGHFEGCASRFPAARPIDDHQHVDRMSKVEKLVARWPGKIQLEGHVEPSSWGDRRPRGWGDAGGEKGLETDYFSSPGNDWGGVGVRRRRGHERR